MADQRIYIVNSTDEPTRLVKAGTPAAAIRHCASKRYQARAAKTSELADLMSKGTALEVARGEDDLGGTAA